MKIKHNLTETKIIENDGHKQKWIMQTTLLYK